MNLGELRKGVYDRCGQPTSDPTLTPQVVDGYVNAAMHMVEAEQDWPWLFAKTTVTTEAGVDTYGCPADWDRTHYLRIAESVPLVRFTIEDLDGRAPTSARGRPWAYAVDTDEIVVRPVPDGVYAIVHRYLRCEPDLAGDDQSPLMPAKFHSAICELATWLALRSDCDDPRAPAALQAYEQVWKPKMKDDARRDTSPGRVRVRPGGWRV